MINLDNSIVNHLTELMKISDIRLGTIIGQLENVRLLNGVLISTLCNENERHQTQM